MKGGKARDLARASGVVLLAALGASSGALAHEERLVIGRVQAIDLDRRLLVVQDAERDRTVRLTVDAETEVQRCRPAESAALQRGAQVRVKYLDRATGRLETLSILMIPGRQ
jgi:hypothetical protein